MQFMILVKASEKSEAGEFPPQHLRQAMDDFNTALETAGVRIMAKGLHPTKEAIRITYDEASKIATVTQGPFENPNDQVAGFFLIDVNTLEEAIAWAKKVPDPQGHGQGAIELRQVF